MEIHRDRHRFQQACRALRRDGRRVGFVPTMGALHAGHTALMDEASKHADALAVSIFVNPLQFAEGEDLSKYPRTLEADLAACEAHGVALVFTPEPGSMYPQGFSTGVHVGDLSTTLEGEHRPTHFDGVTTVVNKLFMLVGECVAVFGKKDYQQWRIIQRMVRDLDMPVEVIGHEIVREEDGLALSSRNVYLSADERRRALALSEGLKRARQAWNDGDHDPARLEAMARAHIESAFDRIDYVALREATTLGNVEAEHEECVMLAAAHLGRTRLIDNLELRR